jgi:acyl-CoA thioester hydrolase
MAHYPREYHFSYPHRVRYAEVDPQEIVFNSRYLEYCDAAVTEYLRALGFPPNEMVAVHHCDLVVVRAEIEFIAPARLDDLLLVYVRTSHVGRSSVTNQFEICRNGANTPLTRASIKYVNFDRVSATAASVPLPIRDAIAKFDGIAVTR